MEERVVGGDEKEERREGRERRGRMRRGRMEKAEGKDEKERGWEIERRNRTRNRTRRRGRRGGRREDEEGG